MPEKIYLHLLILCGIWSQGIIVGIFAGEPSDILVRQIRTNNRIWGESKQVAINRVSYIVHIKHGINSNCVGSILSHHVVITSALCVMFEASRYHVVSSSARSDRGTTHNVIDIRRHYSNIPYRSADGIALLTVDPPFVYGTYTFSIDLHSELLLSNKFGTVSGWGFNCRSTDPGTSNSKILRSSEVRIMAHQDCVNRYRPHLEITDKDICTYHPQEQCGHFDRGAPLVVDGYLAGVHLWTGPNRGENDSQYPDVFAILQHSEYNQWVRRNMRNIEAHFQNRHN